MKSYYDYHIRISDFSERRVVETKIHHLKSELKEEFLKFPANHKKFLVLDKEQMDVNEDVMIKILPRDNVQELKFPVYHPQEQILYAVHPYKDNLYFPVSSLEDVLFRERIDEFLNLSRCLGAINVTIESKRGKSVSTISNTTSKLEIEASRKIKNIGFGVNVSEEDGNSSNNSERSNSDLAISQSFPLPTFEPHVPANLAWYDHEPSWQNLYHMRVEGGLLHHKERISSKEAKQFYSENLNKLNLELELLITSGKVSGNTISSLTQELEEETVWDVTIEFASTFTIMKPSLTIPSTGDELLTKYREDLIFALDDDGRIDEDERKMLERKRINYGIEADLASLIENEVVTGLDNFFSVNEAEYLDEIKCIVEEEGEVSESNRRLLNRLREKLNISVERAFELEASLVDKEIYSEYELAYIEEVKFCLEEDQEISRSERRLLDRERDRLNITEERAIELEQSLLLTIKKD